MYALSIDEVIDYLGVPESGDFTDTDIWQIFWNDNSSHSGQNPWLRSVFAGSNDRAFTVLGVYGVLDYSYYSNSNMARAAFQIDLSKVEWTAE